MPRSRHSKKEIEEALAYVEKLGWRIEESNGHAWGKIFCPNNDPECRCGDYCITSIWSTPRDPANHARQIRRVADNCTSKKDDDL